MFITPGTPRIVIISYSMNYGVKKCVWTALGDVTANIIQATLVIFVIGSFISDNPKLLNTIKWIGIIYILYLAYDIYKSRPKNINSDKKSEKIALASEPNYTSIVLTKEETEAHKEFIKNKIPNSNWAKMLKNYE